MNETKHTPGPWQQNGSHIYGPDPERILILQMHYSGSYRQDEGNCDLIAAAPDLLAALKAVLSHADPVLNQPWDPANKTRAVEAARAAIAKAEGRE